jgi:phage terminase large subunit-like protein
VKSLTITQALFGIAGLLESARVKEAPNLLRVVVGVDPAVTSGEESDSTRNRCCRYDFRRSVITFLPITPSRLLPKYGLRKPFMPLNYSQAGRIIAETNNGGDLVVQSLAAVTRHSPR